MELQDYVTRTYPEDSYRLVVFPTLCQPVAEGAVID